MSAAKAISGNLFGDDPAFQVTGETISVLPPLPLAGPYDYLVPEGLSVQPGDFVEIPLGRQTQRGVVWGKARGDVDPAKLREIYGVLQAPPMADVTRKFVDWVSAYTMAPQAVLRMAMSVADALEPPKPIFRFTLADPADGDGDASVRMTPPRKRVMAFLRDHPPMEQADIMRETGAGASVIKGLVEAGVVRRLMVTRHRRLTTPTLILRARICRRHRNARQTCCVPRWRGWVFGHVA